MKPRYLKTISDLFTKESIYQVEFIQGLKAYHINKNQKIKPKYKKRPYVIYKGIKNNKKVLIKILIRKNYYNFFQRELFVYKNLSKIIPELKEYLPDLLKHLNNPPSFIFKLYQEYSPLGESNLLKTTLTNTQLKLLLEAIDLFHVTRATFKKRLGLKYLLYFPKTIESFGFYFSRYKNKKKQGLIYLLGKDKTLKLEKLLIKTRKIFNSEKKYFCWGDANPSNILFKKENGLIKFKFIDFDKVDFAPLFRDYTTLFYSVFLNNEKLADFFIKWLEKKYPSKNFWTLFYFKLLFYSLPGQYVAFKEKNDKEKAKKIKKLTKIILPKYTSLF